MVTHPDPTSILVILRRAEHRMCIAEVVVRACGGESESYGIQATLYARHHRCSGADAFCNALRNTSDELWEYQHTISQLQKCFYG